MVQRLLENFKNKLVNEHVFGMFAKSIDPAVFEVAGYAGLDFAILDMEHGAVSYETAQNLIRASVIANLVPIIRVPSSSEEEISKALDAGALGVQVPQVTSAEEAERVVKASKFFPEGNKGVCRFVRAAGYSSIDRFEYFKQANKRLVILQLEGVEAIENLDSILNVKGVDILFIGPYDLSQSLGVPGQTMHPEVIKKMQEIIKKASAKGIILGTFTDNAETLRLWKQSGVKYLSYAGDLGILYTALKELIDFKNTL